MAADFTRFDFHAKRFYFSDSVRIMSAEEVGQYILLLVEAWMGGKDASLPDNPKMLARMARVDTVSDSVLAMFPIVQTELGPRRRNETLYAEWTAALERSETGRLNGHQGGLSTSPAKQEAARENGKFGGRPITQAQPNQNNSITQTQAVSSPVQAGSGSARPGSSQAKSSQVSRPRTTVLTCGLGAAAPDPAEDQEQFYEQTQEPNFKLFRSLFNNHSGKALNIGKDKASIARYTESCMKYGTNRVHAAIDSWATERTITFIRDHNIKSTFGLFISQLEKTVERMADDVTVDINMIEADVIAETAPAVLTTREAVDTSDSVMQALSEEEERQRVKRIAKFTTSEEVTIDPERFLED